jgi:hypothetical protein
MRSLGHETDGGQQARPHGGKAGFNWVEARRRIGPLGAKLDLKIPHTGVNVQGISAFNADIIFHALHQSCGALFWITNLVYLSFSL